VFFEAFSTLRSGIALSKIPARFSSYKTPSCIAYIWFRLSSAFIAPKEKGQELNLPARLTSEINNFGPVEQSPIQNLTDGLQAQWDSYD
jgi:hypothetical protein